jgi:hypothetical protein
MLFVNVTVYSIGSMDTTEKPDIHVIPVYEIYVSLSDAGSVPNG